MTMRFIAALLSSCLAVFAAHAAATLDLDGPGWSVLSSATCPESPSTVPVNGKPAWRLEVDGTCEPHYVLRDVNDELRAAVRRGDASLVVRMHVANAHLRSVQDGGSNVYATVMLQPKDDGHRQYALRNRIKLVNGSQTVTIPIDRTAWTDVEGNNAADAAWNDVLANLDKIGIALGGESGEGKGVKGNAGLFMLEFKVD